MKKLSIQQGQELKDKIRAAVRMHTKQVNFTIMMVNEVIDQNTSGYASETNSKIISVWPEDPTVGDKDDNGEDADAVPV